MVDFVQYFRDGYGSGLTGFEYLSGDFTGAYANASSVTGQAFSSGGTAMAVLGPYLPPNSFSASADNQPFSVAGVTPLDFRDTVTFGAGSEVGATIDVSNVPGPTSPVPEPSSLALLGTGLAIVSSFARRHISR